MMPYRIDQIQVMRIVSDSHLVCYTGNIDIVNHLCGKP